MAISGNFLTHIDIPSLLMGALLGAILSIGLDLYIKRPKLIINGWGGGNRSDGNKGNNITVHNVVGWFGINIPETRILGLRIHPRLRFGLPFQKTTAQDCRAQLFITSTNEHVCQLWWSNPDNSVNDVKTIKSGDSASLMLFIKENGDKRYFPFQPEDRNVGSVKMPPDAAKFAGSKDFYIQIHHSYNQILKYNVRISEKFDGKLYLETETGSCIFSE